MRAAGDTPDRYDDLGIPTRWDLRRNMGVCLALNCARAAQGVVPTGGGPFAHDCPCCLEHCYVNDHPRWLRMRLRLERGLLGPRSTA